MAIAAVAAIVHHPFLRVVGNHEQALLVEEQGPQVVLQIEGQGDFLPKYSGNLDIINAAAIATAERIAKAMLEKGE